MKKFDLHNDKKIETGFKIPENYFEDFEARIMSQLPQKEVKVISLWQRKSVWISSAAAVALVVFGLTFYFNFNSKSSLDDTTVENYLASNMTADELMQELDQHDINELEKSIALNDDSVESYLSENENDIDLYLNE
ncbi:hypothetical protein FEDK69T_27650 [Flavobacterium enshiense DK69]|uniref:Uncharacterized protein n=1 Tax=Flavobacterium enshiense DK69 TaxID=1107311 RepID=V6S0R0_9FLAO|nr:hypothetical protein [Flavobacterium enshiense]ESU20253.1 hypothetical protein FEDK69T_27650 [Flavobacterium enshiense DK69]KGO95933.1 hypothetical protein Q767_09650 [Flavobacterium enshiense DK69]